MVADSEMGMDSEDEGEQEESRGGMSGAGMEEETERTSPSEETEATQPEAAPEAKEAAAAPARPARPKGGCIRAALLIIRERIDKVSKDLSSFRKNKEAVQKRLEKQIT